MTAPYRVVKDQSEWAILPDLPWTVYEVAQDGVWGARRHFATWSEAMHFVGELVALDQT